MNGFYQSLIRSLKGIIATRGLKVIYSTRVVAVHLCQTVIDNQEGHNWWGLLQREISNDILNGLNQTAPVSKFSVLLRFHKPARLKQICNFQFSFLIAPTIYLCLHFIVYLRKQHIVALMEETQINFSNNVHISRNIEHFSRK